MTFQYCQSCFKKTAQSVDIPKFCAHCGKPFVDLSHCSASAPPSNPSRRTPIAAVIDYSDDNIDDDPTILDDDDDETEEVVRVPKLKKLNVDVDIPVNKGVPLRSIARNAPRKPTQPNDKPKKSKISKKQFLAQYRKEASTLRPK